MPGHLRARLAAAPSSATQAVRAARLTYEQLILEYEHFLWWMAKQLPACRATR
ncbi:MAG: hypothetical protein R2748_23640 [Bryobacterales bacterium]